MVKRKILNDGDTVSIADFEMHQFLCSLIWPLTESYWATYLSFFQAAKSGDVVPEYPFKKHAREQLAQFYATRKINFYESLSGDTIANAVHSLTRLKVVVKPESGQILKIPQESMELMLSLIERIALYRKKSGNQSNKSAEFHLTSKL